MDHDPQDPLERPPGALSPARAAILYGIFAAVAWGGSAWLLDRQPLTSPGAELASFPVRIAWGALGGLAVVAVDQLLERVIPALRAMSEALQRLLGAMTTWEAVLYALLSATGEELLFRGFLQPWLGLIPASILFGLLHFAPDRRLWPWPLLACAMGFAFGALFDYTGDVLAPILAHFTINYFGFMRLRTHQGGSPASPGSES